MSDLKDIDRSALAGELDTKFTPSHGDSICDTVEIPYDKHHPVSTVLNHGNLRSTKRSYDGEQNQPMSKESNYQHEMDELHGSSFLKSSYPYDAEAFQSERGAEDAAHLQESPLTDTHKGEDKEDTFNLDCSNFISDNQKVNDAYLEKSQCELTKANSSEIGKEGGNNQTKETPSWSHSCGSEPKKGHYSHSKKSVTKSIELDMPQSGSFSSSQLVSPVTKREISVSPERSLSILQSADGHKPKSLQERTGKLSHSPVSLRQEKASYPEGSALENEIRSQDRFSPLESRRLPNLKDDYQMKHRSRSPKRRHSPHDHRRRRDRSVSRSPGRRRDRSRSPAGRRDISLGYRRDHHDRFRSRSPYARDHRRSSRRRYSPRRRSPPKHHSRRHSPRQRPWSPPPNRKTGVGEPGNNLFVAGFNFLTTERDLEKKFSRFGCVRDVRIVRDKSSGDSRGFGFLSLERDKDADAAIKALDETEWNGRIILVEKSKSPGH